PDPSGPVRTELPGRVTSPSQPGLLDRGENGVERAEVGARSETPVRKYLPLSHEPRRRARPRLVAQRGSPCGTGPKIVINKRFNLSPVRHACEARGIESRSGQRPEAQRTTAASAAGSRASPSSRPSAAASRGPRPG